MATRNKGSLPGDIHVQGVLSADGFDYPTESIRNEHIDPASLIDAVKVENNFMPSVRQPGTIVARTETVHVALGKGTVVGLNAGMITPPTLGATVTIDLLKNGTTVLSSTLVLDSTAVSRDLTATGIDTATQDYVADDWFDVVVSIATPTGVIGSGLFIRPQFHEAHA